MLSYRALVAALLTVPRIAIHGPWARSLEYALVQGPPPDRPTGSSPEPLWPGGAMLYGARFTPPGSFPTLYLASDKVTAMIEAGSIFSELSRSGRHHVHARAASSLTSHYNPHL